MACATLKRPIEFDPLHSPNPTKRQRCMPMCISPSNSPPRNLSSPPRPSTSSGTMTNHHNTPFVSRMAKLTPDVIANGILEEMKRLHRRKELHLPPSALTPPTPVASSTSTTPSTIASSCASSIQPSSTISLSGTAAAQSGSGNDDRDIPIFTFRQVEYICSKMLSEQEGKLRDEYNEILKEQLAEQFDIFNRFSVDQIDRLARQNNQTVSYLS